MAAAGIRPDPFPWDSVIAFGLGRLRLSPANFWALSARELGCLMGKPARLAPSAADLAALMAAFPDGPA